MTGAPTDLLRALRACATDWGRIVTARPRLLLRPGSAAEVAAAVRFAAGRGLPVSARGAGHSPFGQSLAAGGVVLDMAGLRRVGPVTAATVTVQAGATWRDVLAATLPRGRTPPVLTDYLDLTVGGTLSVGGLGGTSRRHGAQTDTVVALEVVDGRGEVHTCTDGELFDAVRGGLGQCGVLTGATLRLVAARPRARRRLADCGSVGGLVEAQRVVLDRPGYVEGLVVRDPGTGRWTHLVETAAFHDGPAPPVPADGLPTAELHDTSYPEFLDRMRSGVAARQADGSWWHPHPWLNLLLPDDAVEGFVTAALADMAPADLGASGLVLLYPLRTARVRTPLLRLPAGETVWLFAVLRTAAPGGADAQRLVRRNAELYAAARRAGGCGYPSNAVPMTHDGWREHFGAGWGRLAAAKARFDPAGVLATGQGVFPRG